MHGSALTPAYRRWMNAAFGDVFPDEPRATCADCAMCRPAGVGAGLVPRFEPHLKCCTYSPDLANFLVGRALREEGEGAKRLRAAITRRQATPMGLEPDPGHDRRYRASPQGFGRDEALICPFYDGGRCAIWANRNAVCQTFFCKSDDGVHGGGVWTSLARLLLLADERIAADNVAKLVPAALSLLHDDQGRRLRSARCELPGWIDEDGAIEQDLYDRLWGEWRGREDAFFIACADRADGLDWSGVLQIGGPALAAAQARVREALNQRDAKDAPPKLCFASPGVDLSWEEDVSGVAVAHLANLYDPIALPVAIFEALHEDAPAAIAALNPADRLRLWRAGVLRAGEPTKAAPVQPDETLRVPIGLPLRESIELGPEGQAIVQLGAGMTALTFDAPDLLVFARTLVTRRAGFRASEAQSWAPLGQTLGWEQLAEALDALLSLGILERRASP